MTALCSKAQAQCLVNPDSIKPIVNRDGAVIAFVFPKRDAQKYEHYSNVLVPSLRSALQGLEQENVLLTRKAQLQDTVVGLLQKNEGDLKNVVGKLDTALDKQETIIRVQQTQLKAANREKWVWRGLAGVAVTALILK
jgi:hypothetical protein